MKKKKNKNINNSNKNELKTLIILVFVVSFIFTAFYGITMLVDKKNIEIETEILQETIQYDEILIGQILNRPEKEYFVLIEQNDNYYNSLYIEYLNNYVMNNKNKKFYTVDLNNLLNIQYIGESTKINKENFYNSIFADTALLKIKNNQIIKAYLNHNDIISLLKEKMA